MKDHDDADVEFVNWYLSKNLTKWVKGINRKGEDQSIYIPYIDANPYPSGTSNGWMERSWKIVGTIVASLKWTWSTLRNCTTNITNTP
jgi:hypothetical protein